MALASQSSRMDRHSSSSRGRGLSTILVVAVASGTALGGAYWLMSGEGDALRDLTMPRSASAADGGAGFEASTDGASRGGTPSGGAPSGDAGLRSASPNEGAARDTRRSALDEAIAFAGTTGAATERAASQPQPRMSAGATESATAGDSASAAMSPAAEAGAKAEADSSKQESSKQESPKQESPKQDAPPQNTNTQDTPKQDAPAQGTTPPTFRNGNAGAADQSQPAKAAPAAGSPEAKLAEGLALGATEPVKSRLLLSQALLSGSLSEPDARNASNALAKLSAQLFLTPVFNANDPSCTQYTVQPNDSLEKIVRKQKLGCDWRLVARINNIRKPEAIQVGKRLKLPRGPFSAVVSKRDYRIDICMGEGDARIVVASMPVGLGASNGTPLGRFKVRAASKLLNPEWIHPVTGQRYEADDPANPIGEHWLGLEGLDESNSSLLGYGIHGTVEPDSIGQDHSLGCVRLLAADVALVWESLAEGAPVEIRAR
jgi:LysM repeat protein